MKILTGCGFANIYDTRDFIYRTTDRLTPCWITGRSSGMSLWTFWKWSLAKCREMVQLVLWLSNMIVVFKETPVSVGVYDRACGRAGWQQRGCSSHAIAEPLRRTGRHRKVSQNQFQGNVIHVSSSSSRKRGPLLAIGLTIAPQSRVPYV